MTHTVHLELPFHWGSLTLSAPPHIDLMPLIQPLAEQLATFEGTAEDWATARSAVLFQISALPALVNVALRLENPLTPELLPAPDWIRLSLERMGWSQERLASELGVTANTVWRWCSGRTPLPPWLTAFMQMAMRHR